MGGSSTTTPAEDEHDSPLSALRRENEGVKRMIRVLASLPPPLQDSVLLTLFSHYDGFLFGRML